MPSPSRCMQTRRKIADPLEACTREEQDAVTRFLGVWRYEAEKYACPECIVPGEECWEITFSQREPLESGDICLFVFFFLEAKMLCSTSWAGKCMLTHFWDCLGQLMEHYSPMEITINREAFCDLLQNHLKSAVRSRCRGLLSSCVLLRRDKAQPHTPTCNSSTNYEYVLGVSSTSNAFIWYRTMWLSHVWTSVEEVQHKR